MRRAAHIAAAVVSPPGGAATRSRYRPARPTWRAAGIAAATSACDNTASHSHDRPARPTWRAAGIELARCATGAVMGRPRWWLVPVMCVVAAAAISCGGARRPASAGAPEPPQTAAERLLAMLPQGAQVVIEVDLARLRTNPVVGEIVTRALAERVADLPAGVPASPLAAADRVVLAAYGVGTAQAATLTLLGAPHDIAGATRLADGVFAVGPPDWVEQAQQRIALASTGERKFAISAPSELLELRRRAMPAKAPGASLRVTARLPFDARVALARQTGLDAAPAQLSAWGDVVDDLALIVDCDAADPGSGDARRPSDAPRRLEATLRGALAAISEQPLMRALGLPSSLAGARFVARGSWVRTIIAIGPAHLQRIVRRATVLLRDADREPASASPSSASPSSASPAGDAPSGGPSSGSSPSAAVPRGDHAS
jgi:hypothetical protein